MTDSGNPWAELQALLDSIQFDQPWRDLTGRATSSSAAVGSNAAAGTEALPPWLTSLRALPSATDPETKKYRMERELVDSVYRVGIEKVLDLLIQEYGARQIKTQMANRYGGRSLLSRRAIFYRVLLLH